MKCPVCLQPDLVMTERQGIEIDYCPQCRGVWLDRGELDKIIERSAAAVPGPVSGQGPAPERESVRSDPEYRYRHDDDDRDDYYHDGHRRKKRRGFLGDIFDFD
jgi:Zn-finger nucleic acid-binding protein